ncbi:hypothetical protein [Leifsonia sp. Leaf264]|uniref:hypothetical protein n=1 Tax=Leifsonia sp. Leaf264 TaxID=1736314 RepID=UPI0006F9DF5E|nr:hypothetical protein [Leifsonia sp. Leaf264]KQO98133.1 hypothetical protein ASF30_08620 [Leifsonia sp. Leaf264]
MTTKTIRADQAHQYVGRHVEAMFTDGWDDWPVYGTLMSVDPVEYMVYLEVCSWPDECDHSDWEPGAHGASAITNDSAVRVAMNGNPNQRTTRSTTN